MSRSLGRARCLLAAGTLVLAWGSTAPILASCGDSVLDGGEACDAGPANGTATACCASDCQFEPASKTCRSQEISYCDIAETCTGSSDTCPADAVQPAGYECGLTTDCVVSATCDGTSKTCPPSTPLPDSDGDSSTSFNELCDAYDPCTNVGGARDFDTTRRVFFSTRPTSIKLVASFAIATPFADLDPEARGALIALYDPTYEHGAYITLEPGTYGGAGTKGWYESTRQWNYVDATGSSYAIRKVKIQDRSTQSPGRVIVKVAGSAWGPQIPPPPFTLAVTLGSRSVDGAAGRCGETIFGINDCSPKTALYGACVK